MFIGFIKTKLWSQFTCLFTTGAIGGLCWSCLQVVVQSCPSSREMCQGALHCLPRDRICHRSGINFNISVSIRISFCHSSSPSNKSPQVCHHRESVVSDGCTLCTSKECSRKPLITSATSDNTPTSGKPCCNGDVNPWCTTTRANLHVCVCVCRKSY